MQDHHVEAQEGVTPISALAFYGTRLGTGLGRDIAHCNICRYLGGIEFTRCEEVSLIVATLHLLGT